MEHGPPGSWDDTWLQPATVLVEDGTYRMWFHGRAEDYYSGQIGYAESSDGINWTKWPDPVLEPADYPGSVEASFLYPSVVFDGTTYHMWYVNDPVNMNIDVHYAYSSDGIEWTKHRGNPVHELADETIFTVSVLPDGDTWQMWYTHLGAARDSLVSYATSDCCRQSERLAIHPGGGGGLGRPGRLLPDRCGHEQRRRPGRRLPVPVAPKGREQLSVCNLRDLQSRHRQERPLRQRPRRGIRSRTQFPRGAPHLVRRARISSP